MATTSSPREPATGRSGATPVPPGGCTCCRGPGPSGNRPVPSSRAHQADERTPPPRRHSDRRRHRRRGVLLLPGQGRAQGRRHRARRGRGRHDRRGRGQHPGVRQGARTRAGAGAAVGPAVAATGRRTRADAELEPKGGLVVAAGPEERRHLEKFAAAQAAAGVEVINVGPSGLRDLEPHLADGLAGGVLYPEDMQVQPMMAAALMLRAARDLGAELRLHEEVTAIETAAGRVAGVRTSAGGLSAGLVVNAAGTWAGELAARAGLALPVLPRRGFIVVTEPLPRMIRHKVYTADYVANVASGSAGLEISTVVEATASGTVLIGACRER